MAKIIPFDFLLSRLEKDIKYFYETYYFGSAEQKKFLISLHLSLLHEKYSPERFSDDLKMREEEIREFLTMLQRCVDGIV